MAEIHDPGKNQGAGSVGQPGDASASRDEDALYQGGRVVARILGAEVDLAAKEIRISEVYNSDELVIPEECEFRQYRILIQRIAFATKIDKAAVHKGRILRGATADILGYRER